MAEKFLDENITKQVREFFADMQHPVKLLFFGSKSQNCEYCEETQGLLNEVADLHDLISIETYDIETDSEIAKQYNIEYAPLTVVTALINGETRNYNIRFAGIPAGHEFTSLINTIVMVSKQDSGLSPEIREQLAKLETPVTLQVFVTPTCPYCPRAVILSHQMALESDKVIGEMVEATEFEELSAQFGVSGVPHTVINSGAGEVVGAVPENNLMAEIERALSIAA